MIHKYDGDWETLRRRLCKGDVIEIKSIQDFFKNYQDMEEKTGLCAKLDIVLREDSNELRMCIVNDLLSYASSLKQEELRIARNRGIKKALEKKQSGEGKYGRPCVSIPKEFDDMILLYERRHKPLEEYRKQINMKRSTFYKYAKKAKASL